MDEKMHLLVEILNIQCYSFNSGALSPHLLQITTIPTHNDRDDLDASLFLDPVTVIASGIVSVNNKNQHFFIIHGTQYIHGGDSTNDFLICCHTNLNPRWRDSRHRQQPSVCTPVTITGTLQHFTWYRISGMNHILPCTQVAITSVLSIKNTQDKTTTPTKANEHIHTKVKLAMKKHNLLQANSVTPSASMLAATATTSAPDHPIPSSSTADSSTHLSSSTSTMTPLASAPDTPHTPASSSTASLSSLPTSSIPSTSAPPMPTIKLGKHWAACPPDATSNDAAQ